MACGLFDNVEMELVDDDGHSDVFSVVPCLAVIPSFVVESEISFVVAVSVVVTGLNPVLVFCVVLSLKSPMHMPLTLGDGLTSQSKVPLHSCFLAISTHDFHQIFNLLVGLKLTKRAAHS